MPVPMRQYDARRLEMLAVIMALEHFKPFIEGVRVQLDTDHRNLTWIQNVKHSSGQLARWAMRLSEFNFDLRYRPGVDNQVADALSRNPLPQELSSEEASSVMFAMYFQRLEAERCTSAHYASDTPTYMVSWGKIVDPEVSMGSDGVCHARTIPTQEASDDSDCESSGDVGEQDMDRLMALAADTVTLEEIKPRSNPMYTPGKCESPCRGRERLAETKMGSARMRALCALWGCRGAWCSSNICARVP